MGVAERYAIQLKPSAYSLGVADKHTARDQRGRGCDDEPQGQDGETDN